MKSFDLMRKGVLAPFVVLTATLILLNVLSNVLSDQSLKTRATDEQLIDNANDQQMRSLQIIRELTTSQLEGRSFVLAVDSMISALAIAHRAQICAAGRSAKIYSKELRAVNKAYLGFSISLRNSMKETGTHNLVILLSKQNGYIQSLEALIITVSKHSKESINISKSRQKLMMFARIFIITTEAIFLFVPAVNRIKRQNERLRQIAFNQSHLVRHPLANIKGLLALMETVTPEEKETILSLVKTEAEKLDEVIHHTVKEAEDLSMLEQAGSERSLPRRSLQAISKRIKESFIIKRSSYAIGVISSLL